MPSIYVTEAEIAAMKFCSAQVSDAIERGADDGYCQEAEIHLKNLHALEQKFRNAQSSQRLNKALKARYRQ